MPIAEPEGLSSAEAAQRLSADGANTLPEATRRTPWHVLRDVLREPMLLLLLAATGLYLLLGDRLEATLLAASVLVVIALTAYQSERTERALQSLKELGAQRARVLRDGAWVRIPAAEVVRGDVFEVVEGDRVPADARILASTDLQVDESMLTGESVAVDKASEGDGERTRLYSATLAVRGSAIARVEAIGQATAVGRIGASVQSIRAEPGPMQREIRRLVRIFALLAAASCVAIVILHYLGHRAPIEALLAGITLAIAIVPEEFPVVLAIFLAIGAWRLARANALVRRLSALETLGAVDVLCTDKTGTLTENRMRVARVVPGDDGGRVAQLAAWSARSGSVDPMDRALVEGWGQAMPPAIREYPFASARPAVGQLRQLDDHRVLACKGAPEYVARLCALDEHATQDWLEQTRALARQGLRVLAVAEAGDVRDLPASLGDAELQWRGLVAFADPLRAEAAGSVREAQGAGIRVLLLTGDHVETAAAIAAQAGVAAGEVVTGAQLEAMDEAQLQHVLDSASVFARVRPEHKLRLVEALHRRGAVVAMTGDGVNDAPALAAAQVGIAMGGRGTDVAREAAGMVLLDDDFSTIVRAIRMGRHVHDNLRRALRYIVSVHVPIAGMALVPVLLHLPIVLQPLHLVVLELVIDPACSIVFEREAPDPKLMTRPPEGNRFRLFDRREFTGALASGIAVFALIGAVYATALWSGLPSGQVSALAFTCLLASNLALILRYRGGRSLAATLARTNLPFAIVATGALLVLLAATRADAIAPWFGFQPPPFPAWLAALLAPLPLAALMKRVAAPARIDSGQGENPPAA